MAGGNTKVLIFITPSLDNDWWVGVILMGEAATQEVSQPHDGW